MYLQQISSFSLGISSNGKQYFSFFKSKLTVWNEGVIQRLQVKKKRGRGVFFQHVQVTSLSLGTTKTEHLLKPRKHQNKMTYCKKLKTYSTHHKYWLTPCQLWCFNPREIGLTVSRAGIFKNTSSHRRAIGVFSSER